MNKKIILMFIFGILLINFVSASSDLEIGIKPHYFKDGREIVYTPDIEISAVSFEIIGINHNPKSRVLNLTIIDAYPLAFKNSLPFPIIENLRILQTKTLFISQLIDVEDLNQFNQTNISLWVGVEGILENSGEVLYKEKHINVNLIIPEKKESIIMSWGERIWEGNSTAGILLFGGGSLFFVFIIWRYKATSYLNKWRENAERRSIEKRKHEEGYY